MEVANEIGSEGEGESNVGSESKHGKRGAGAAAAISAGRLGCRCCVPGGLGCRPASASLLRCCRRICRSSEATTVSSGAAVAGGKGGKGRY